MVPLDCPNETKYPRGASDSKLPRGERIKSGAVVDVEVIHARRLDADQGLARTRLGRGDVFNLEHLRTADLPGPYR